MRQAVIIGAGHAGSQCAVSLREAGFSGSITLIGDDPALPYQKPPLSKTFLKNPDQAPMPLRSQAVYDQHEIRILSDVPVSSIHANDKIVTLGDGSTLPFTDLVLATGARNRQLPSLPAETANVQSLRTLADATRLREHLSNIEKLVIIGGGFIGLEVAACLNAMAKSVTVLEAADRILGRVVAPEISQFVHSGLTASGIDLRVSTTIERFNIAENKVVSVVLANGDVLESDAILVGIGAIPNVELAVNAGLSFDNGIRVDSNFQTSSPNIHAIGDCARFLHWQTGTELRLESVQNATDQARALARHLVTGEPVQYRTVPWFWSDIGSMKLQIAGLSNGSDERIVREEAGKITVTHLKNGALIAVETINNAADHMLARALIDKGIHPSREAIREGTASLKRLIMPT